jgi:hypothetical protein
MTSLRSECAVGRLSNRTVPANVMIATAVVLLGFAWQSVNTVREHFPLFSDYWGFDTVVGTIGHRSGTRVIQVHQGSEEARRAGPQHVKYLETTTMPDTSIQDNSRFWISLFHGRAAAKLLWYSAVYVCNDSDCVTRLSQRAINHSEVKA